MNKLPDTGFLTQAQILGRVGITDEQAEENRRRGHGPKRARFNIPALIPVGKSTWWDGIGRGRFPKPIKIGKGRGSFWRVEDIRELIASAGGRDMMSIPGSAPDQYAALGVPHGAPVDPLRGAQ